MTKIWHSSRNGRQGFKMYKEEGNQMLKLIITFFENSRQCYLWSASYALGRYGAKSFTLMILLNITTL